MEGSFRFRVSDAVDIPSRGFLLRLRLMEGMPSIRELGPGRYLRLRAPDGVERLVRVMDFSSVGGRATQARLERMRELDVIISKADAHRDGRTIQIGWNVIGAVASPGERAA